jgi:hypothetical protein
LLLLASEQGGQLEVGLLAVLLGLISHEANSATLACLSRRDPQTGCQGVDTSVGGGSLPMRWPSSARDRIPSLR